MLLFLPFVVVVVILTSSTEQFFIPSTHGCSMCDVTKIYTPTNGCSMFDFTLVGQAVSKMFIKKKKKTVTSEPL